MLDSAPALAFWSAPVLWRFWKVCGKAAQQRRTKSWRTSQQFLNS
jgi:hypothetical protein